MGAGALESGWMKRPRWVERDLRTGLTQGPKKNFQQIQEDSGRGRAERWRLQREISEVFIKVQDKKEPLQRGVRQVPSCRKAGYSA